jgi:prophage maintenance system killer protein
VEEPKFLTLAEILYLHDESLARYGGSAGIRDQGLVESAMGSAQNAPFPKDNGSVYSAMIEIANKPLDKRGLAETLRRLVESAT